MEARLGLSEPLRSLQVTQAGPVAEVWLSRERKGNALVRPRPRPRPPRWPGGNPRRRRGARRDGTVRVVGLDDWRLYCGATSAGGVRPARSAGLASGAGVDA